MQERRTLRSAGSRPSFKPSRRFEEPPWLFIVPAVLLYGVVVLYASVAGVYYAFTAWDGLSPTAPFVGLANFQELAQSREAADSLRNTVLIALVATVVQNLLGLLLALGLHSHLKSRYVLRVLFFAPVMLAPIVVAFLFQYIYSPMGFLNYMLAAVGLENMQQAWLGNRSTAIWSVITVIVWQFVGFSMVIFLAGLQGVPQELYDAADIDGANGWNRFWNVTLPLIAPAITVNLTLSVIAGLKIFDQVWAMTQGGPGHATATLSVFLFRQAFLFGNYGYGMAIALVLTIIVTVVALIQLKILRSREVEG
ncbi:carbohydrate ABC transporter permease [uncultured Meiothermus sp.]|uniref:carbohydrate ABC transporter permease n=1 Tax=uncultured Meiothermus sp. TaxID=157471 RepID=UPI00261F5E33|nr:sugar ABC transporter permease [uncultured Meiothermus sp.]